MHSVHIAEWILALVTTRDRAASTAGDLAEGATTRGVVWFWSGVLRTAASLLWRDVAEQPARVTGLAFLGLAVYIGIDLLFAGLSGAAFFWAASGHPIHSDSIGWKLSNLTYCLFARVAHPIHSDSIGWKLWLTAPAMVSSLLTGRMLARWAPRRELAACVVYTILASIYNLVPMLGDNGAFSALLCILIVPAGAAWGRYRRLRAT